MMLGTQLYNDKNVLKIE